MEVLYEGIHNGTQHRTTTVFCQPLNLTHRDLGTKLPVQTKSVACGLAARRQATLRPPGPRPACSTRRSVPAVTFIPMPWPMPVTACVINLYNKRAQQEVWSPEGRPVVNMLPVVPSPRCSLWFGCYGLRSSIEFGRICLMSPRGRQGGKH